MELRCPRCTASMLVEQAGSALGDSPCPSCKGTFLPSHGVERLVHTELGIEVSTLRELMGPHAGTQLQCPGCSYAMSHVTLKGVSLEICTGCGSMWLDEGELERLSQGRYTHGPLPSPPAVRFAEAASEPPVPVGTAAEVEIESVPKPGRRRPRLGCLGTVALLYAAIPGCGFLTLGLVAKSWVLTLLGGGAFALAAFIWRAPRLEERDRREREAEQPRRDRALNPPAPSAAPPETPSERS